MDNGQKLSLSRGRSIGLGRAVRAFCAGCLVLLPFSGQTVELADAPLFSTVPVPGNLALALSVEYPTASTPAYPASTPYSEGTEYLGYFDPRKCYQYVYDENTPSNSYFKPNSKAKNHQCLGDGNANSWSGNFMNWVSMQTLDTFRWVLTGGYRSVDTPTQTILTKTYHARGGGVDQYGNLDVGYNPNKNLSDSGVIQKATPLPWSAWNSRVYNLGTALYFTNTGDLTATNPIDYTGQNGNGGKEGDSGGNSNLANGKAVYRMYINVLVCDPSMREANCVKYGKNWKPEGLLQKYASRLRYSAFGYLNDSSLRDGGVMRARMKYIGPTETVPGTVPVSNARAEWDARTGVMFTNPDSDDANATSAAVKATSSKWTVSITNSGVMNYLNKFGYGMQDYLSQGYNNGQGYKGNDPVGELYYAVTRYFKKQGNVQAYTDLSTATWNDNPWWPQKFDGQTTVKIWLDGFPVIKDWDDPIRYACQKNFILGVGDINNWFDGNLPGSTLHLSAGPYWGEPPIPPEVSSDTSVNVEVATNMVGKLEGKIDTSLGDTWNDSGRGNTLYIAGLAYAAHTQNIRPDIAKDKDKPITINTYWLDVNQGNCYAHKNQFWLAAKYGGFAVPSGFSPFASSNNPDTLPLETWHTATSGDMLPAGGLDGYGNGCPLAGADTKTSGDYTTDDKKTYLDPRPDNYFTGNSPKTMKDGLTAAFEKIAAEASAVNSTALAGPTDRLTKSGNANYSVVYDNTSWTSTIKAQLAVFDSNGEVNLVDAWDASALLTSRAPSSRLIVTCCTSHGDALPFTYAALSGTALNSRTYYDSFGAIVGLPVDAQQSVSNYIDYLRGDRSLEATKTGGIYRNRKQLPGDIVDSKLVPVGPPGGTYYEIYNPGYSAFKAAYRSRPTMLYAGANDGMLHAFDGTVPSKAGEACTSVLTTPTADCGKEVFAYIPSFVYGNSDTATTSGLASLGNPTGFSHHFLVDATPVVADVDFYKTPSPTASAPDWRTILVGGLGKGGNGYYAIDVTDPKQWTSESKVADTVLWEFTDDHMGYTYGDAVVVKTPEYGWTVILPSGYNNDDGRGYLYFINPRTGALLRTVAMPEGSTTAPLNLGHIEAYVPDATNGVADSVYAVDLRGDVWRVDLTATTVTQANRGQVSMTSSFDYTTVKLASLTDAPGQPQPISTRPLIQPDPSSLRRYVLVGTGQLLSDADTGSKQTQTFYAIADGGDGYGGFYNTAAAIEQTSGAGSSAATTTRHSGTPLPASISFPVTRSVMAADTDPTVGIGSSVPASTPMGWYFDLLNKAPTGSTERVNIRPDVMNGIVGFATNVPNGDVCSPTGKSYGYAISFGDGTSVLTSGSGVAPSFAMSTTATDVSFKSVDGTPRLYIGGADGKLVKPSGNFNGKTSYKRLNWREVPTAD